MCLFGRYEYYLLRIAEKYVGHTSNAEDIVMEAFIRIIPHLDKSNCADGHKTRDYLVTLVENLEIATLLNIKERAIAKRLERARKRLKKVMDGRLF